jgi:hypothetical protein
MFDNWSLEMSDYEFLLMVRQAIVNRAAEVFCYNWSDDFSSKRIKEIPDVFLNLTIFAKSILMK